MNFKKYPGLTYSFLLGSILINNICGADELCKITAAQKAGDYAALYRSTSDYQVEGHRRFVNSDVAMLISESLDLSATAKIAGDGKIYLTFSYSESLENVILPPFPLSTRSDPESKSYLIRLKNRPDPIQVTLGQVDIPVKKLAIEISENYGIASSDILQTQWGGEDQFRALILERLALGGHLDRTRKFVEKRAKQIEEADAQWVSKNSMKLKTQGQATKDINYYQTVINRGLQPFVAKMRCYRDEEVATAIENLIGRQPILKDNEDQ